MSSKPLTKENFGGILNTNILGWYVDERRFAEPKIKMEDLKMPCTREIYVSKLYFETLVRANFRFGRC